MYCAANACIEQVIQHGEVDVFQAVKTVRRHRPQLIENMVNTTTGIKQRLPLLPSDGRTVRRIRFYRFVNISVKNILLLFFFF